MIASLLFALALGSPPGTEIDVRKAGPDLLDVRVRGPLAEVLDRISRETGMKVTYEGGQPRQIIAAEMRGVTVARTVLGLLEGQGLSYMVALDPTGRTVTRLMMFGSGPASRSGAAPPPPGAAAPASSSAPVDEEEFVEEEEEIEPEEEPEPEPEPVNEKPVPQVGPGQPGPPGIPGWKGAPGIPTWNGGALTPYAPGAPPPAPGQKPDRPEPDDGSNEDE